MKWNGERYRTSQIPIHFSWNREISEKEISVLENIQTGCDVLDYHVLNFHVGRIRNGKLCDKQDLNMLIRLGNPISLFNLPSFWEYFCEFTNNFTTSEKINRNMFFFFFGIFFYSGRCDFCYGYIFFPFYWRWSYWMFSLFFVFSKVRLIVEPSGGKLTFFFDSEIGFIPF